MIYDVLLLFIIIFSIFIIIIILARKIPYISLDIEAKKDLIGEEAKKQHKSTILFCKALSVLEKALRQIRIHILKLDTKIFGLIQYLRDKSAKRLEEINRISYKSFTSAVGKEANKYQFAVKRQNSKKDVEMVNIEEKKLLRIIAKNPKNAENYKKLGMLYFKNDNFLDAEAAFQEYLKLNPSDNQIREIAKKIALVNKNNESMVFK